MLRSTGLKMFLLLFSAPLVPLAFLAPLTCPAYGQQVGAAPPAQSTAPSTVQSLNQSADRTANQSPASVLAIDAASPTGEVIHGATGWLYGQSEPGIPPAYLMQLLKPQIAAQKPPDGLQHPGGDAFEVMPGFKAAGGKFMQIYVQDIYPDWPYNDNGLEDYMAKVAEVARKVVADPNRGSYVYVPFNEPNNNWYDYSGPKLDRFLHDWLAVYKEIRSIDSTAKIAGPNYERLDPSTYEAFFTFARDNHVLPDETTWHELHDDFFTGWYQRYDWYRAMERRLGIGPIPIVINEYTRDRGDLAVPGNLVQWIARLENSKVDGCLAFWTPAGTMADLTARIWPSRATGAWWVYDWYAEMTGHTLRVAPPDLNAFGLQGIASADAGKKQLRVLFGGTGNGVELDLSGLAALPYFRTSVHVAVWSVDNSGVQPSPGPILVSESDLPLLQGRAQLKIAKTEASSAYYAVLSPSSGNVSEHEEYSAIYAALSGGATPAYGLNSASVTLRGPGAAATFPVTAADDGDYIVSLRYAAHTGGTAGLSVNDVRVKTLVLPALPNGRNWVEAKTTLFLGGGVNAIKFSTLPGAGAGLQVISLNLTPATGPLATYSVAGTHLRLEGGAVAVNGDATHSWISLPAGAASLRFDAVSVAAAGRYKLIVTYSNDEKGHKGTVDELAHIVVNGSDLIATYFRQTFGAAVFCTKVIDIELRAGMNTIQIAAAPGHRGPNVTQIQIAKSQLN